MPEPARRNEQIRRSAALLARPISITDARSATALLAEQ